MSYDDQQRPEDRVSLALLKHVRAHLEILGDTFPASLVARAIELVEYREHDIGIAPSEPRDGSRRPF